MYNFGLGKMEEISRYLRNEWFMMGNNEKDFIVVVNSMNEGWEVFDMK